MKYTLTIADMNEDEFAKVFNAIHQPTGDNVVADMSENDIEPSDETINFDKEGLPWDARIHSSNHKLTSKGVWQRRKGITDDEYTKVKNELLGVEPPLPFELVTPAPQPVPCVTQPEVVAPAPIVQPEVPNPFLSHTAPQVVQVSAPATPDMQPVQVSAPATPAVDSVVLYQTMIDKIKNGLANQTVKANDVQNLVNAVNTQFGTQYQSLAQVKDNIPATQFVINSLASRGL